MPTPFIVITEVSLIGWRVHLLDHTLCTEALSCESGAYSIKPSDLPGFPKMIANNLSRHFCQVYKVGVQQFDTEEGISYWDYPDVNFFTTITNRKCQRFCLRAGLGPHLLDTFLILWSRNLLYAYRTQLLLKTITKIRQDTVRIILITPAWLRQVWFLY